MNSGARARHAPKSRAVPRPAPRQGGPRHAPVPLAGWRRWRWVAVLVLASVIGLPVAHALFGEVVALLGGTFLLGLLVGRWTAR